MSDKIKLGIIGIGNMGSQHAGNILAGKCPEIELAAVADTDPARIDFANANYPETVAKFSTAEELINSGLCDSVLVAVPHYDHPTYAIMAMEKGLNVMVEKPAGVYTKHVNEMNAVAKKHPELVYGMMFNQRTNHIYRKMREIVQGGEYGAIKRTNWIITNWYRPQAYYDSGSWRATWSGEGGGVLLNQCPHQLDLFQWICGMPTKVSAHVHFGKWHDIEVEDDVTAYMEFANGATGVFVTTTGDACGSNRFEVQLERGKIVAEDDKLYFYELEVSEPEFSKTNTIPFGCPKGHVVELETDGENTQHNGVLNAFASAILHGTEPTAYGYEGINGLTLSNAMHLSQWLEKPVELPFDEDLYYNELMKRVATSRRKENVKAVVADLSDTYGGTK